MKKIILILNIFLLLTGCSKSELLEIDNTEDTVILSVELYTSPQNIVESRATNTSEFQNINIFLFDSFGDLVLQRYYSNLQSNVLEFIGIVGTIQIVAVANTGEITDNIESLSSLQDVTLSATDTSVLFAQSALFDLKRTSTTGEVVEIDPLYFTRYRAKVTVVMNFSGLYKDITITPTNIALRQVPSVISLLGDNTPSSSSEIDSQGESIQSNLTPSSHDNATPIYMFENLQGTSFANRNYKRPRGNILDYCTYLEITTQYQLDCDTYEVVYRHYIGNNETDNFDVNRNTWYRYTVYFTGYGGFYENTWRVSVTR